MSQLLAECRSEPLKPLSGQSSQPVESGLVDAPEVEARFPLHALPQLRVDTIQQLGKHVDRHQIIADIVLLDLNGGEEQLFVVLCDIRRIQRVATRCVCFNNELWSVRYQERLELLEDCVKVLV